MALAPRNMNSYYDDDDRSVKRVQPGISRSSNQRGYSGRSSGYSGRSSGAYNQRRSAPQPTRRPASSGGRPPQNRRPAGGRRPVRRRRSNARLYMFIALIAVVLVVAILIFARPGQETPRQIVEATPSAAVVAVTRSPEENTESADETAAPSVADNVQTASAPSGQNTSILQMLGDSSYEVEGLAADQMVKVTDLSIKEGLPEQWLNVLLLGTDERTMNESARTDAMMICSINTQTGDVKLTSIMRDLAVEYSDLGDYNGTYGINAANYFGGPSYAMKTVNRLFDMNIQYYVMINFFGFGKIAQQLGGVEVDISEAEMNKINEDQKKQFKMAYLAGITDFDTEQKELTQYGENIHLNGNQTLAYARIRHLEGGDYMRTTRQQTVLKKLLAKARGLGMMDIIAIGTQMYSMVKTNIDLESIFAIANVVLTQGVGEVDTLRLPIAKTYAEEVRNEAAMLYDCDFPTNAIKLYNFIYE